jgi:hypothetical protein
LHAASEIGATDERKDETSWRAYEALLLASTAPEISARDIPCDIKIFFH